MGQQLVNALVLGSILLLFSLGLSLAWGTLDTLNLAHGSIFVLGGYLGYEVGKSTTLPFVVVLAIAMIGSGVVAAVIELIAFGQIRSRNRNKRQAELSMLVASLGASVALNQFVSIRTGNVLFTPTQRLLTVHQYEFGGVRFTNVAAIIVLMTIVVALVLGWWIRFSREGKATRAVAYSPGAAQLVGINVRLLGLRTMFISGALAGLAGLLLAFQISGETVDNGGTYMLSAFAILVFGGVGSVLGATIAAYVIALAETLVIGYGPAGYSNAVAFALIFVMLLVRPGGIIARAKSERA